MFLVAPLTWKHPRHFSDACKNKPSPFVPHRHGGSYDTPDISGAGICDPGFVTVCHAVSVQHFASLVAESRLLSV